MIRKILEKKWMNSKRDICRNEIKGLLTKKRVTF